MQSFKKSSFFPIETQDLVVKKQGRGSYAKIEHEPGKKGFILTL